VDEMTDDEQGTRAADQERHAPPLISRRRALPLAGAEDVLLIDLGDTAATTMADGAGHSLWSSAGARSSANLRLQTDQGRPMITCWESRSTGLAA
jgi:hypothetical protein